MCFAQTPTPLPRFPTPLPQVEAATYEEAVMPAAGGPVHGQQAAAEASATGSVDAATAALLRDPVVREVSRGGHLGVQVPARWLLTIPCLLP